MSVAVASLLCALAVALTGRARPGRTRSLTGRGRVHRSPAVAALAGPAALGLWWWLGARHLVLAGVMAGAALGALRLAARKRAARRAQERTTRVLAACDAMAADLAAGQPPRAALRRAAGEWPELEPVAVAAELDSDVPAALRLLATVPGAGQLRTVAAAWQVAHRSGTGLASTLSRIASILREEQRTRRLVATELAAARATARTMAALPAMVLLLGAGIGGDPIGFLLDTPVGLGCLVGGLGLTQLGLLWLERVADGVLGRTS